MLSGTSCCVFLLLIYGFVTPPTDATSCSATNNVCSTTLRVTSTCTSSTCVCSSTDYTAVATGCVAPLTDFKPTVRSVDGTTDDAFSGEVKQGQSINLKCDVGSSTVTGAQTYEWYTGDTLDSQQGSTLTYPVAASATAAVNITCKFVDSGLESSISDAFTVTPFANIADITQAYVISGKFKGAVDTQLTLSCINRPKDDSLKYEWNDVATTTDDQDLTVTIAASPTAITCTVTDGSNPVGTAATLTPVVFAPDSTFTVEIYDPSAAITVKEGVAGPNIQCRISDGDVQIAKVWEIDGTVIDGQTSDTLNLPSTLTAGDHDVVCKAGNPAKSSSALTVTVVADGLFKVATLSDPASLTNPVSVVVGGYMKVRCLVFATSLTGLTYAWSYDGIPFASQDDYTLQISPLVDANHGDHRTYKCSVSKSHYLVEGVESNQISAVAFTSVTAEVSSNKGATSNYGTGNTYILTCGLSATSPGVTYKWFKAGTVQTGETSMTYSITATSSDVVYKCQGVFDSTDSLESPDLTVTGKDITEVVLTGVASPVEGTTQTYTCTVYTGASVGSITYDIQKDGTSQGTASQHTITSIALTTSDGAWKCAATIGSQTVESNIINVAAVAKPAKPTVDIPTQLNLGGSYTLTCTSTSHDSTAVYEWVKTTDSGDTPLSSTASTYYISAISSADAAQYKCKLTVNSQASDFSELVTVTVGDTQGKVCTENTFASDCGTDFTLYTGNCINSRCECVSGVPLSQDTCGSSGSATVAASALVICLGWLTYHLMP